MSREDEIDNFKWRDHAGNMIGFRDVDDYYLTNSMFWLLRQGKENELRYKFFQLELLRRNTDALNKMLESR